MRDRRKRVLRLLREKNLDAAVEECREYLALDEDTAMIHVCLAYCYADSGKYAEALSHYAKAESCTDADGSRKEIVLGRAQVRIREKAYEKKTGEKKKQEVQEVFAALRIYTQQGKKARAKECIKHLLHILEHSEPEKFREVLQDAQKAEETRGADSEEQQILSPEEIRTYKVKYAVQSLRIFHRAHKNMVESGAFLRSRAEVTSEILALIGGQEHAEEYIAECILDAECMLNSPGACVQNGKEEPEFTAGTAPQVIGQYISYLGVKVYVVHSALHVLHKTLEWAESRGMDVSSHQLMMKMISSDFTDAPSVSGTMEEFRPLLYNTLSPTILFLRFGDPKPCELLYRAWEEEFAGAEVEANVNGKCRQMFGLKRQYFASEILRSRMKKSLSKDTGYNGSPELDEVGACFAPLAHPAPLVSLFILGTCVSNLTFLKRLFAIRKKGVESGATASTPEVSCAIDEAHIGLIEAYIALLDRRSRSAHAAVEKWGKVLDTSREEVRRMHVRPKSLMQKLESAYSFGKFMVDYLDRVGSQNPDAVRPPGSVPDSTEKTERKLELELCGHTTITRYRTSSLQKLHSPNLPSVGILRHAVYTQSLEQRHLIAVQRYERGSRAAGIAGLQEVHKEKEHDWAVVSDLSRCLEQSGQELAALEVLEEYLRGRVQRQIDVHLCIRSMRLLQKAGEWQRVEMRCKDLVSAHGYHYIVHMSLAQALAQQKKFRYSLQLVTQALEEEQNAMEKEKTESPKITEQIISAHVFAVHLKIQMEEYAEALDRARSSLELAGAEHKSMREVLVQYGKYACASMIQQGIRSGGISRVRELIAKYNSQDTGSKSVGPERTPLSAISVLATAYVGLLGPVLGVPDAEHRTYLDDLVTDMPKGETLITDTGDSGSCADAVVSLARAKLLMVAACRENRLENPEIQKKISECLKIARTKGETKEALEVELLLRLVRGESVEHFYSGERQAQETPASRAIISLLYFPNQLSACTRDYLKYSSISDADFLLQLARGLSGLKGKQVVEDLESAYLHLCRRYSADAPEISWVRALWRPRAAGKTQSETQKGNR